ncbi:MAG: bile acid:sodium symporter family protein [Burkholderiales bacterium]|nr:bile acid:sodium symporter family protein [Burkholderiales bacterium]OJX05109.1 MAG: symporter [Burkholderiales bacterium 70-64]
MTDIDLVRLNFNPQTLFILNCVLGFVMFGVSLELKASDFREALRTPRALAIGLLGHHLVFPAFTYLLVLLLEPRPSIALGMILVSSCPAGNISNFLTHFARGNTALSVSISTLSTLAAIFMTPLNIAFWGGLYEPAQPILRQVAMNPLEMFLHVLLLLGLPLAAGLLVSRRWPRFTQRAQKPMKVFSLVFFLVFVLAALGANWQYFTLYVGMVVGVVFVHNASALLTGYGLAWATGLPERDRRAVCIECGIQNSGLGLILIFNFFDGLGGMAVVTAWWGIWHIVAGLSLATFWSRQAPPVEAPA